MIRHTSFILPAAEQNPRLRFWSWFDFSAGDYGLVQIKTGSGEWQTISPPYINKSSGAWTYPSIDLKEFSGSSVQIAFQIITDADPTSVNSGWYIDDISFNNITRVNENLQEKIKIYPNPTSDKAIIDLSEPDMTGYNLSVFNLSGKKVLEMDKIASDKIEMGKGNLPAGIYIIELKGNKVYRNKIIIR